MEEQRRPASWLATQIFVTRTHIYKIIEKESIDCHLLMRISCALNHDFFADLTRELNEKLRADSNMDTDCI